MLTDHLWEVLDLFPMLEADEYGVEKSRVTATIIDRMPSGEDKLSGPIIAERRLSVRISETEVQEVVIRMAAPERREREDDYRCSWELVAPGYRKTFYARGADGFHAIHLATRMIGVNLWCIAQEKGYHFTWLGSDDIDFPEFHA